MKRAQPMERAQLTEQAQPTERARSTRQARPARQTDKGKQRKAPSPSSSSDGHDSEEDTLMERELERLKKSGSTASALWATMPEFAGMTNAI
ncbi:MAG: hypothetical protein M1840_000557 [Geoglossum simile]|nr:MAG: hypothetical protein M1840_000557 [Geoglossum simile]